ncbi:MAG: hypothetical protein NVSMB21_10390 [Vulcanimicrobiaceae bacterium]
MPWPLTIALVAPHAGRLSDRIAPARLATAGLAILAVGLVCLAMTPPHAAPWDIVWRTIVCGFGFGFFQAPNNRELLGSAPRHRSGSASGILGTVRLLGQSLGAALVGMLLARGGSHGARAAFDGGLAAPAHLALWLAAASAATAAIVSGRRLFEAAPERAVRQV